VREERLTSAGYHEQVQPGSPPPKSPRATVEVSRGLLLALVTASIAGLLAVTYLVGRESGRREPQVPATTMTLASALGTPPDTRSAPHADASPPPLPAREIPASSRMSAPTETSSPNGALTPHDTLRDDVANYFREVETIQGQARSGGDPEALARKLLEQAANGDVSGFDALAAANQKVRDGLRAIAVPEPCREHHRLTLALLDESIAMLQRVKGLINGADTGALAAMPAEARELERRTKDVDAMAAEIKRRFGL